MDAMNLLMSGLLGGALFTGLTAATPDGSLFDFGRDSAADWMVVNDGVMGGVSRSEFVDSNGGFASIRGLVGDEALDGAAQLVLRVRGDGRTYQVRLRTDRSFDGMAYALQFETEAGEWQEVVLDLSDFQPTWRGYRPRGAPPLDPGAVLQFGFLLADKREGPFSLDIAWVQTRS